MRTGAGAMLILYGLPHSLYTGKVRAYLRKRGLAYVERSPAHPDFRAEVVPRIGRAIIPVLQLPDGAYVQDSADIIDHLDRDAPRPGAVPEAALQRVVALVVQLYAVAGLTRHAMHYRWSCFDEQSAFLTHAFRAGGDDKGAQAVMARMAGYLPMLGVTAETAPAIKGSYHDLLDALEGHFARHPYLLGGAPSIGDYALFGPLFAHLGRDPVPSQIMKNRAPSLFRWTERMQAPDADMPEFPDHAPDFLPDDAVADSLAPLLRHMGLDLFPGLQDMAAALALHVADHDPAEGAPVTGKPHQRILTTIRTRFRGVPHDSGVQPYLFYLWQKITDSVDALDADTRQRVATELDRHGLGELLTIARPIRVERRDHREVWGRRIAETRTDPGRAAAGNG